MVQARLNPRYDYLMQIVAILPEQPGVYRYYNKDGVIIYVGKAKNLRRRVSSYFTKEHESARTANLVVQIYDLKYIVVNTESDALNLENRMIKAHQPKYNVLLKDSKTYPWICVRAEAFPRVFLTRSYVKDGSSYYGPYTNVMVAKTLIELFQQLYHIRTCSLNLQPTMIEKGYKCCLKYHIGNCLGPCIEKVSRETYEQSIEEIKQILRGHTSELMQYLKHEMQHKADLWDFEAAEKYRQRIEILESYRTRHNIIPSSVGDVDVFGYDEERQSAVITFFHIVQGAIICSYTIEYTKTIDEPKEDLLAMGIAELYSRFTGETLVEVNNASPSDETEAESLHDVELIVPFEPTLLPDHCTAFVPQRGDKHKLLLLAEKNCKQYRIDQLKQQEKLNPDQRLMRLLTEIQQQLALPTLPHRIESFDNSNISGAEPVGSCVVFENGKPLKSEYRRFCIRTVVGPNDYASMHEVVFRRYRRLIDEEKTLPNLILADGGVGQMSVIKQGLADVIGYYRQQLLAGNLSEQRVTEISEQIHAVAVGGLVKDNHHRTSQLLFGDPPAAVDVKHGSELFHLLEQIQDEVHRFAITFHRERRSKQQTHSVLEDIPCIGPKMRQALLKKFRSVARIRQASTEELAAVVGPFRADKIRSYFSDASPVESPEEG